MRAEPHGALRGRAVHDDPTRGLLEEERVDDLLFARPHAQGVAEPAVLQDLGGRLTAISPPFDAVHAEERAEQLDGERPVLADATLGTEEDRRLTRHVEARLLRHPVRVPSDDLGVHHPVMIGVRAEQLELAFVAEVRAARGELADHPVRDGLVEHEGLLGAAQGRVVEALAGGHPLRCCRDVC